MISNELVELFCIFLKPLMGNRFLLLLKKTCLKVICIVSFLKVLWSAMIPSFDYKITNNQQVWTRLL